MIQTAFLHLSEGSDKKWMRTLSVLPTRYRWRGRSHFHGPILDYIFCYAFHLVKQVFPYEVGDGEILSHYASVPCLWMLSFAKSPSDSVAPAV